jgi:enoyl-CoA hydratase
VTFGTYTALQIDRKDDLVTLALNRPDALNAVNGVLHKELSEVFADIARDPSVGAVVLTGNGRLFCAGGDLEWLMSLPRDAFSSTLVQEAKRIVGDFLALDVPVVAAVNGAAIGFGATLALFADIIFMGESATICDPHVRVGMTAGDGGAVIWPWLVGMARAKQYLLTGDPLDAREAERIGLVNFVVPDAEVLERAEAFAQRFVNGARIAQRTTKRALNRILADTANLVLDLSLAGETETFSSADHAEGMTAFIERRPPVFRDR